MRGWLAMPLMMGLVASLAACDESPPLGKNKRHLENPPPKPPNCPDLPELENITLKDGAVADVRILQFGETKLYVPVEIVSPDVFVPEDYRDFKMYGPVQESQIGRLQPFLMAKECPGVIHKYAGNIYGRSSGIFLVFRDFGGSEAEQYSLVEPVNGVSLDEIILWQILKENGRFMILTSGPNPHASIAYDENLSISFQWNEAFYPIGKNVQNLTGKEFEAWNEQAIQSSGWKESKQAVFDFVGWLATPPRERDNDRRFKLKDKR